MNRMAVWGGWPLALALVVMSALCRSADGAEPLPEGPFAVPGHQPAKPAAQRDAPRPPAVKPDERLQKLDLLIQLMQANVQAVQQTRSPNDDTFLADSLCLLHVATRQVTQPPLAVNEADVLTGLIGRPWQRPAGEAWRMYLTRLVPQAEQAGDQLIRRLAERKQQYAELTKDPWPFDWQARRALWLDLVELMLATKAGEDVKVRWPAEADKHAPFADLFRKAYIVSVRASPTPSLDWEFIQPLVASWLAARNRDRLRWSTETLAILLSSGRDGRRQEVSEILLRAIRDEGDTVASWPYEDLNALGRLYQLADERAQPEAVAILSATLNTQQGLAFPQFATAADISPERRRVILLAASVRLPDEGTLEQRFHNILNKTRLLVWIDETVIESKARPDTGVLEGSRLEVLEKLLAGTNLRLELLASDLFWIGPQDRLAAARQLYADSLQRTAKARGKVAAALVNDTRMEFIQTPLADVIAFLHDQHDLGFELLDQPQKPITMNCRGEPLHLALTHLARLIDGDWCAAGDVIFVGSKERLAPVQQFELLHLRRWSRLGLVDNAVTRALRADTRLEFIEAPLSEVAAFLAEQHKVPIRVGPAQRKLPVTQNLKGISLEQALDILCLRHDLRWETDGQSILIGTEAKAAGSLAPPPSPKD